MDQDQDHDPYHMDRPDLEMEPTQRLDKDRAFPLHSLVVRELTCPALELDPGLDRGPDLEIDRAACLMCDAISSTIMPPSHLVIIIATATCTRS